MSSAASRKTQRKQQQREYAEMRYPTSPLHPSDYNAIVNAAQQTEAHTSTVPEVRKVTTPERKQTVSQERISSTVASGETEMREKAFMDDNDRDATADSAATAKSTDSKVSDKKDFIAHKWPGHNLVDKMLLKMQKSFGHNGQGPDYSPGHMLEQAVKDAVHDVADTADRSEKIFVKNVTAATDDLGLATDKTLRDVAHDAQDTVVRAHHLGEQALEKLQDKFGSNKDLGKLRQAEPQGTPKLTSELLA